MTAPLAPEAVVDQYAHRGRLRDGVTEIVKEKARRKHKRVKLTDEERRRQGIERQILEACEGGAAMRPAMVARSIYRNAAEVRGIMMDLTHRGRLESEDGYATFRTVRA